MANNFDNPYSANVVGLWDFRDGYETNDTGLGDGIAQDGTAESGATFGGGWMLTGSDGGRLDVDDGDDAPFDLTEGTIISEFKSFGVVGDGPETVMSRGNVDGVEDTDHMEIRVTADGAVQVYHVDGSASALLTTDPGFFTYGDIVKVSYAWTPGGVIMTVENTTQGTSTTVGDDVEGLSLDIAGEEEQSFAIGARETTEGSFDQTFNGAIDYVAVLDADVVTTNGGGLDGIVEGTEGDDVIDTSYLGDPEGDRIDNEDAINPADEPNDDLVNAGGGDDTVEAGFGDDTIHGGSGNDVLNGGSGDDVIEGDTDAPGAGTTGRTVFEWDRAPDPDDGGEIDDEDDLSGGFTQEAGGVTVTYSEVSATPDAVTQFDTVGQFVGNINADGSPVDPNSGLGSVTGADGGNAVHQLDFSDPVQNISFRINDIDGDGLVRVTAYDAGGNPVVVNLAGGPALILSDTDGVTGNDTATSDGSYASNDNPDHSLLVTIPGPISRLVISHEQDGGGNSGITVSDIYFDATQPVAPIVPGNDTIDGGDGDDVIIAGGGDDDVTGGDGSDSVDGGDGDDVIDTSGGGATPLPDRGFPGYAGTPTIPPVPADADPTDDMDTVDGGDGNDTISTGDDADVIQGGAGNDVIDGGIDDDLIDGGADDDLIIGGEGADSILGSGGNDTIYGGLDPAFPDALNIMDDGADGRPVDPDPTNGMDTLDGGDGNDVIYGQDDDDLISGGSGDDFLDGGIDNDTITGDAGVDVLLGGQGNDNLSGGDDTDLVLGGDGDDTVSGDGGVDLLGGGAGNDLVDGGAETDAVFGGDGEDTLIGGDGSDLVVGGADADLIYGDADDTDEGNSAGGAGDVLLGGDGDDTIIGGSGADIIDGAAGADSMVGGADEDVFIEVGPGDVIDGSESGIDNDTIVISGPAIVNYDPTDPEAGTIDFYDLDTQTIIGTASFSNIENILYVEDIVNPVSALSDAPDSQDEGDALPDVPSPPDVTPTAIEGVVEGTAGRDIIDLAYTGDPEGDMIDNGDAILPGEGPDDDIVQAGGGDDDVFAGLGDDDVFGGSGNDFLAGEEGDDILRGEDGDDSIFGGVGNDQLSGGVGADVLDGGADDDILSGGSGDDSLTGNVGDDFLVGGTGDDTLGGGEGNDLLLGGSGDDAIDLGGDDDLDLAYGNLDSDTFTGIGAGDTIYGGEDPDGLDRDVLDLRGAAAAANPGGSLTVEYDPGNPENGVVTFFNADGDATGTAEFYEIEEVIVPCFTPGTLIATPQGERNVEDLCVGDRVITRDNGIQAIRWIGTRKLAQPELADAPQLQPILIRQGALGNGLPERDMMVSPNHRILVANDKTALYFEDREVLVAAKHLVGLEGVDCVETSSVTYIHFMFEQHEVVLSDGAWTESFQPGDLSLRGLDKGQREELLALFPELDAEEGRETYSSARRSLKRHEARLLIH